MCAKRGRFRVTGDTGGALESGAIRDMSQRKVEIVAVLCTGVMHHVSLGHVQSEFCS